MIPQNTGHNRLLGFSTMTSIRTLALTMHRSRTIVTEAPAKPVTAERRLEPYFHISGKVNRCSKIIPGAPKLRNGGAGLLDEHMFCVPVGSTKISRHLLPSF
jgi:hypothetical protein